MDVSAAGSVHASVTSTVVSKRSNDLARSFFIGEQAEDFCSLAARTYRSAVSPIPFGCCKKGEVLPVRRGWPWRSQGGLRWNYEEIDPHDSRIVV